MAAQVVTKLLHDPADPAGLQAEFLDMLGVVGARWADHPAVLGFEIYNEPPVGQEEDSQLGDFLPDEKLEAPSDAAPHQMLREQVPQVLDQLPERERRVLKLRFGLEEPMMGMSSASTNGTELRLPFKKDFRRGRSRSGLRSVIRTNR